MAESILFCPIPVGSENLLQALREAARRREVHCWPNMGRKDEIGYLVGFNPPANVFDSLSSLRLIHSTGAGANAILAIPGRPKNVPVARVVNKELSQAVAQYVVHAVVRETRDMRAYDRQQRDQQWNRRPHRHASDVSIGILGLGAIGEAVAAPLGLLGYQLRGWSRTPKNLTGIDCYAGTAEFPSFLAGCDVVVVLLPDTVETRNLVSAAALKQLPEGAAIIAVGRGGQVDEDALVEALDGGHLSHAYLDVMTSEPLPQDSLLWTHPSITVTPHIAGAPHAKAVARLIVENIDRVERGEVPVNVVDESCGY